LENNNSINLTSAELSHLWNTYMGDSMAICVLSYFIENTQDTDIKANLYNALSLSKKHVKEIGQIFKKEKIGIPYGFNEEDVNVNAPALFLETFYLSYLKQMSRIGITAYGLGLSLAVRGDVRTFYRNCLLESMDLDEQVTNIQLNKGLYVRAPFIVAPNNKVEFVNKVSFMNGVIGEQRPLLGMEVAHLYGNIQTSAFAKALCIGFSQAAQSKEVTTYMVKSRDKAGKHIDLFSKKINESHLKVPMTWNDTVTDSTISPFSDKLMMFHLSSLAATAMADYGVALASSARRDLGLLYAGLIAEMGLHIEDGAKIMIENSWMEKPPSANDRDRLANK
jgi:Protein of unknown function (DUF3231)